MGLKRFLKAVEAQRARDAFRAEWMAAKYAQHPEMDEFEVNVKYVVECNEALVKAGLLK
jgi:lactate dehydrogenase-like 2-hydroxyacid dehydrogenase